MCIPFGFRSCFEHLLGGLELIEMGSVYLTLVLHVVVEFPKGGCVVCTVRNVCIPLVLEVCLNMCLEAWNT